MHWEILSKDQRILFGKLAFLRKFNAYLAGGTALAIHLGHRTSEDFDFYMSKEFNSEMLSSSMRRLLHGFVRSQVAYGTVSGDCKKVHISCFYYDYPLIKPLVRDRHVDLASVEDIGAMKLIAISQRGKRRDFLDVYTLSKMYGLDELMRWVIKKYRNIDSYILLKGLTYFEDADNDATARGFELFKMVEWEKVKKYISNETFRLTKKLL